MHNKGIEDQKYRDKHLLDTTNLLGPVLPLFHLLAGFLNLSSKTILRKARWIKQRNNIPEQQCRN